MDALQHAIGLRQPRSGLIHHSDRSSRYCSADYRRLVKSCGFIASMSGRGNCYDNAMVESVFKTIKPELIWRTAFATRDQASKAIGQYIEGFYNTRRRHSSFGFVSPTLWSRRPTGSTTRKSKSLSTNYGEAHSCNARDQHSKFRNIKCLGRHSTITLTQ